MPQLNTVRDFGKYTFVLSEKLDDYRTASLAQAEYWAAGFCCRKVPVTPEHGEPHWEIWVGPPRLRKVRLLPGETIQRRTATRVLSVA